MRPGDPPGRDRFDIRATGWHEWSNGPGTAYGVHRHGYIKVLVVVDGSITFVDAEQGTSVELHPGDRVVIPADAPHSALVGPLGVTCREGQVTEPPG
ncbi:MAG: cupin domain-containing protein [Candidatus Dormibacteria bacterium]